MNTVFTAALSGTLTIMLFVAAGYILRKGNFIPENASTVVSAIQMKFFIPLMQIYILMTYVTLDDIKQNWFMVVLSVVLIFVTIVLARPISTLLSKNLSTAKALTFAMVFSNFGFMALPIIESIYDANGFMLFTLFDIPYYIAVNSIGQIIIEKDAKFNPKSLFLPINISIIIGILIVIFDIRLGSFLENFIHSVYVCVTPLAMTLAGIVLAKRKLSDMFKNPVVYTVSALRLIVIPLILWGVLYALGVRGSALSVPVLVTAMPVAANGVMLAENGGGDSVTVAQSVFISTLFSVVTIPVLAYFIV